VQKLLQLQITKKPLVKVANLLKSLDAHSVKQLKPVYVCVFLLSCYKFVNVYVVLLLNVMVDLSITLLYLNFKGKKQLKVDDVVFDDIPKVINSNNFDDVMLSTRSPQNMNLPFLLGFDGKTHVYADLSKLIHTMIAGRSGMGKSNFINQILQSLLFSYNGNLVMFLCDMKQVELCHDYACFPQVTTFSDENTLLNVVKNIRLEMQKRYKLLSDVCMGQKSYKKIEDYNKDNEPLPYVILLVDEFADINCLKDENIKNLIWDELKEILRKGRAAGCIVILATQRPTKENIIPSLKGLMVSFIGFGVRDNNESFYCGVKNSANLAIGEFIIAAEGDQFNNKKLKSYHIKHNDKIYYQLYKNYKMEENEYETG
jgi:S-DNA-T family DNA segregation ATPase FtsK/SpoIIIE